MRIIIIILTSIFFQTVYAQNERSENIILIDRIVNCYSDSIEDLDIPMKFDIYHEYNIEIYSEENLIEPLLTTSSFNTYELVELKKNIYRIIIKPILSNKILLDTTIKVVNDTLWIEKCIGEIFSESKLKYPKLEAQKDIKNGKVQIKLVVVNSGQDHSLKRMNKISKKYDFEVKCIGHHWYPESIQYLNSYNSVVFLYLKEKYGKKTIEKVVKKLRNKQ